MIEILFGIRRFGFMSPEDIEHLPTYLFIASLYLFACPQIIHPNTYRIHF